MGTTHELTGGQLVAGTWIKAPQPTLHGVNPATGETLHPAFGEAGASEVDRACTAAAAAWPKVRTLSSDVRATLLETIAEELEADGAALCARASLESGLPAPTRLKGELGRTTGQLRLFAALLRDGTWVDATIDRADRERKPAPKPDLRRMQQALGPVAVFGASNFPLAFGILGGDTASALAAGCPVVAKGHPGHPGTSELAAAAVLRALEKLRLPPGFFGLLQGAGHEVGGALVQHPAITAVGFTGSLRGGRALFDLAAKRPRPIPVYAEMGSLNPLVVLPGAIAERSEALARGLAGSLTLGAGQFCTKPGLILTLADTAGLDGFLDTLAQTLGGVGSCTMLNAGLRQGFAATTATIASTQDVTTIVAGGPVGHANTLPALYSVSSRIWLSHPALHAEAFGPAALVVTCTDLADLEHCLTAVGGSLTGTLHSGAEDRPADIERLADALAEISGRVIFNGFPTGVEVCHAMVHGGPYPATSAPGTTSVGTLAIRRFTRPVAWQDAPEAVLPRELRNDNVSGILRRVDGEWTRNALS